MLQRGKKYFTNDKNPSDSHYDWKLSWLDEYQPQKT